MNESGLTHSSSAVTAVDALYIHPSPSSQAGVGRLDKEPGHTPAAYNLADDEQIFNDEVSFTPVVRTSGGITAPQPTRHIGRMHPADDRVDRPRANQQGPQQDSCCCSGGRATIMARGGPPAAAPTFMLALVGSRAAMVHRVRSECLPLAGL